MKFRKRPIPVDAQQFFPDKKPWPVGVEQYTACREESHTGTSSTWFAWRIQTLEGLLRVRPGDWIITGVRGEHYPCKPDIFAETYEPVDPDAQQDLDATERWAADLDNPADYGQLRDAVLDLIPKVRALRAEPERFRLQLSACSVAAINPAPLKDVKPGDPCHSLTLQDVLKLRAKYDALRRAATETAKRSLVVDAHGPNGEVEPDIYRIRALREATKETAP